MGSSRTGFTIGRSLRAAAVTALLGAAAIIVPSSGAAAATGLRDVVLVGNSAAGTVSILDGHAASSAERIASSVTPLPPSAPSTSYPT